VEFELTIPASEPAKTVHAFDHAATVTGEWSLNLSLHKTDCLCVGEEGGDLNTDGEFVTKTTTP
jgi:hypothetical protein